MFIEAPLHLAAPFGEDEPYGVLLLDVERFEMIEYGRSGTSWGRLISWLCLCQATSRLNISDVHHASLPALDAQPTSTKARADVVLLCGSTSYLDATEDKAESPNHGSEMVITALPTTNRWHHGELWLAGPPHLNSTLRG